jgi:hypothetical protein
MQAIALIGPCGSNGMEIIADTAGVHPAPARFTGSEGVRVVIRCFFMALFPQDVGRFLFEGEVGKGYGTHILVHAGFTVVADGKGRRTGGNGEIAMEMAIACFKIDEIAVIEK